VVEMALIINRENPAGDAGQDAGAGRMQRNIKSADRKLALCRLVNNINIDYLYVILNNLLSSVQIIPSGLTEQVLMTGLQQ